MNLLTLLFDRFTILLTAVLPAQGAFAALFDGLTHAGIALLFFLHGARLSRRAIIDGARIPRRMHSRGTGAITIDVSPFGSTSSYFTRSTAMRSSFGRWYPMR